VDTDGSVGVLLEQGCCWLASSVGGRRVAVGFCGGQSAGTVGLWPAAVVESVR